MNYDSYFSEYLNRHHMTVEFYDPTTSNDSDFMNKIIEILTGSFEQLYQQMSRIREIETAKIHTKCISKNEINAFCFWHPEQEFYGVAITSATYIKLYKQLSTFAHNTYLKNIKYLNSISPDELKKRLFNYAIQFISKHEYMHIVLGHCRLTQNKGFGFCLGEHALTGNGKKNNLYFQAMERLADSYAVTDSIAQLLVSSNYKIEEIKTNLLIYYLSILHIFSLFYADEDYDWKSPNILDDLLTTDHPATSMRFYCIAETIDGVLLSHYEKEGINNAKNIVNDIDQIINTVFEISKRFHGSFQIDLVYPSYSLSGMRYNVRLFNAMSSVISDCESVALFQPISNPPIDEEAAVKQMHAIQQELLQK